MTKDKKIKNLIKLEKNRQETCINLIASENYISESIINMENSILTNKYAEGYPNKRYYAGCKYIDKIEETAINRAKKLFKVNYANVQPHSGSQANQAAYMSLCKVKEKILGMKLEHGGHLTHGHKINFSGKTYNFIQYGVNKKTGYINYDDIDSLAKEYTPKLIIAGASAYSRIIDWKSLKRIAKKINAFLITDISHVSGLIVSNLYPSPINYADVITSTTQKTLRGPRGGLILTNNKKIGVLLNTSIFPGIQGGPLMNTIAAKACCFKEALTKKFKNYQKQTLINSKYFAECLKYKNFEIISNGTDTHLFLINLKNKKITGINAEKKLETVNIIVNKNVIPNDTLPANITSGIRIGTPAITTRNFRIKEIKKISEWINYILKKKSYKKKIKLKVINLCKNHPMYIQCKKKANNHNEKNI
ncbi:MAG TPA: serine hydroxymethyltransferase [Candidatus Azoamicus sp. OHIO1]